MHHGDKNAANSPSFQTQPVAGEFCNIPPLFGAVLSRRECTMATKTPPIPPLFKADAATLSFYGSNTGAVCVSYHGPHATARSGGGLWWGPQRSRGPPFNSPGCQPLWSSLSPHDHLESART